MKLIHRAFGMLIKGGITGLLLALAAAIYSARASSSAALIELSQPESTPVPQMSISDETCLACHGQPNISMALENGELLGLFIPPEIHATSVHGEKGYACVQCHTTVGDYPHPPFSALDARDASLKLYPACQRCHSSYYDLVQDSVHSTALAEGNRNAAICTDCHTAHTVRQLTDPQTKEFLPDTRQWIPQTCARCHYAIYQKYSNSVHGSALLGEGNPDVPTCIDCHGVHNIEDPTTAAFRLQSPQICAKCHTDPGIMDKYGISTNVLSTYVADFHGSTVTLFEKQHPDQETNKPVCYDCHGIHDIKSTSDPEKGLQVKENLLARCQVCHPDASANFPTAWLSHYIPSPDRNPLVFSVKTFYKFFIPGTLGGMAILVLLDISGFLRKRLARKKSVQEPMKAAEGDDINAAGPEGLPEMAVIEPFPVQDSAEEAHETHPATIDPESPGETLEEPPQTGEGRQSAEQESEDG